MIPSIEEAYNFKGPTKKELAASCKVATNTIYKWMTGRAMIPKHRRQTLERAMGQSVDWSQYQSEYTALNRPQDGSQDAQRPKQPTAPQITTEPPESATGGLISWLTTESA